MIKLNITVEISVADNVADIYPNYSFNYRDEQEFIDFLIDGIETPDEYEGFPFNNLKKYGYSIKVLSRDETKLIDIINEKEI
jgi:hypothetical protein